MNMAQPAKPAKGMRHNEVFAEGWCNDFEIELHLESAAPAEKIAELIRLAHRMCFTEVALTGRVELSQRHLLNGQPLTDLPHESLPNPEQIEGWGRGIHEWKKP